ncbi:hypothetical protein HK096_004955 [Nowakowskiella sp. JEL0078]|nr:hypothetical protein HK096_004955 [Nowakowskiella sp. JEL0078]
MQPRGAPERSGTDFVSKSSVVAVVAMNADEQMPDAAAAQHESSIPAELHGMGQPNSNGNFARQQQLLINEFMSVSAAYEEMESDETNLLRPLAEILEAFPIEAGNLYRMIGTDSMRSLNSRNVELTNELSNISAELTDVETTIVTEITNNNTSDSDSFYSINSESRMNFGHNHSIELLQSLGWESGTDPSNIEAANNQSSSSDPPLQTKSKNILITPGGATLIISPIDEYSPDVGDEIEVELGDKFEKYQLNSNAKNLLQEVLRNSELRASKKPTSMYGGSLWGKSRRFMNLPRSNLSGDVLEILQKTTVRDFHEREVNQSAINIMMSDSSLYMHAIAKNETPAWTRLKIMRQISGIDVGWDTERKGEKTPKSQNEMESTSSTSEL